MTKDEVDRIFALRKELDDAKLRVRRDLWALLNRCDHKAPDGSPAKEGNLMVCKYCFSPL